MQYRCTKYTTLYFPASIWERVMDTKMSNLNRTLCKMSNQSWRVAKPSNSFVALYLKHLCQIPVAWTSGLAIGQYKNPRRNRESLWITKNEGVEFGRSVSFVLNSAQCLLFYFCSLFSSFDVVPMTCDRFIDFNE